MGMTHPVIVDDDGSGMTGTPWNNAWETAHDAAIDAAIAAGGGGVTLPIAESDVTNLVTDLAAKRPLVPRVTATTSWGAPAPNADTTDLFALTAQAAAAAFVNPAGTPANGQQLIVRIKDNGTAQALTWGTAYVAGGVALPSTTVISKTLTIEFLYNADNALNKWMCVAVALEDAAAGGGISVSRCACTHSVAQSITDAAFNLVLFDTEDYDVTGIHSTSVNTSRFTIPTGAGGLYLISAVVAFAAHATGQRILKVIKNGADFAGNGYILNSGGAVYITGMSLSVIVNAVAGDYFELHAYQNSGGALNIGSAPGVSYTQNRMQLARIA